MTSGWSLFVIILTVLNIFGIWRWLGRQSRVEEGARTAAQASEAPSSTRDCRPSQRQMPKMFRTVRTILVQTSAG